MVPDQPPPAVQDVALDVVHVRVALCPGITELGVTFIVTMAGGIGCTGLVAAFFEPPPHPERTKAKTKNKTSKKQRTLLEPVGSCIAPPFRMNPLELMLD